MAEKTEELRDIFQSVTDEDTVTESQEEGRGSLAADPEGVDEGIRDVIERMREQYDYATDLADDALVTVVRRFFEGEADDAIADALAEHGVAADAATEPTVFTARMDLHLVREDDAPVETEVIRRQFADDAEDATIAREMGVTVADVERARRVLATETKARQVSDRFRSAFEDALAEAGLTSPMTAAVRDDGLDEATEDIGSLESDADVDF